LIAAGVDPNELVHVPLGLDHRTFRLLRPIDQRPRRVAMMLHPNAIKGTVNGLAALGAAKAHVTDLEAVVFSRSRPLVDLPSWIRFVRDPSVEGGVEPPKLR
jgi:hypothetical protein